MLAATPQEPAPLEVRLQHVHEAIDDLRLIHAYYQLNAVQHNSATAAKEDWAALLGYVHNVLKDREKSLKRLNETVVGA